MMLQLFLLKEIIIDFIFWFRSQDVTNNVLRNADLTEKRETFKNKNLLSHIKDE